jgi:hypothetical protein
MNRAASHYRDREIARFERSRSAVTQTWHTWLKSSGRSGRDHEKNGDDPVCFWEAIAQSLDHFAAEGAIYRRPVDGHGPLVAVAGGLPNWMDGIADTGCIATHGSAVAIADRNGNLY